MFVPVVIQPAGGSGNDWLAEVIEQYPYPLACAYRRLRDDVLAHTDDRDALRQLIRLKDCVETLVKYVTLVVLSARLDRRNPIDALDRQVIEKLVAPSLGTWAQGILQPLVRAASTHADARLAPLVAYTTGKFFAEIQEFTAFRNAVLGHGLVRDPREDRHDLSEWLPRLNRLLVPTGFLAAWELVQQTAGRKGQPRTDPITTPPGRCCGAGWGPMRSRKFSRRGPSHQRPLPRPFPPPVIQASSCWRPARGGRSRFTRSSIS